MRFDNDEESLEFINRLLERLHQADYTKCSKIEITIIASGAQQIEHLDALYIYQNGANEPPVIKPTARPNNDTTTSTAPLSVYDRIRHCLSLLMEEKYSEQDGERTIIEPLFNQQSHWQAIYRCLVDKDYCEDSDFDGFDVFIRKSMPDKVNKPYSKASVKQISQTDFSRPLSEWRFDAETSKTRKPFDRMAAVARRFINILEENKL